MHCWGLTVCRFRGPEVASDSVDISFVRCHPAHIERVQPRSICDSTIAMFHAHDVHACSKACMAAWHVRIVFVACCVFGPWVHDQGHAQADQADLVLSLAALKKTRPEICVACKSWLIFRSPQTENYVFVFSEFNVEELLTC